MTDIEIRQSNIGYGLGDLEGSISRNLRWDGIGAKLFRKQSIPEAMQLIAKKLNVVLRNINSSTIIRYDADNYRELIYSSNNLSCAVGSGNFFREPSNRHACIVNIIQIFINILNRPLDGLCHKNSIYICNRGINIIKNFLNCLISSAALCIFTYFDRLAGQIVLLLHAHPSQISSKYGQASSNDPAQDGAPETDPGVACDCRNHRREREPERGSQHDSCRNKQRGLPRISHFHALTLPARLELVERAVA